MVFQGEQGSGKSTATRVAKRLVDPVAATLRTISRDERELAVMAESNWALAFDNPSGLPTRISDALCRLVSGGDYSTRKLYSDYEESVFDQMRLVILNGIDAIITRLDLLDRAMVIRLSRLTEYRDEERFWAEFEEAQPAILGALLDIVAAARELLPSIEIPPGQRMADFVRWMLAAENALGWDTGTFIAAYEQNQAEALRASTEGNVVSIAVMRVLKLDNGLIEGTPTDVLDRFAKSPERGRALQVSLPRNATAT